MVTVPPEDQLKVAGKIKENYSYVCQDIVKEFRKYDVEPYKFFERYEGENTVTGKVRTASQSLLRNYNILNPL